MMSVLEKIINQIELILKENEMEGEVSDNTSLLNDFAIDSVVAIEILVSMEELFDITIDDEDLSLELLDTPITLCKYIERQLKKK